MPKCMRVLCMFWAVFVQLLLVRPPQCALRPHNWALASHCPAWDISVPLSEIYCTYHVTDWKRTAAGLLPLLVRPPGTVFWILSIIQTPPKMLSGACLWHFCSHSTSAPSALGSLLVDAISIDTLTLTLTWGARRPVKSRCYWRSGRSNR